MKSKKKQSIVSTQKKDKVNKTKTEPIVTNEKRISEEQITLSKEGNNINENKEAKVITVGDLVESIISSYGENSSNELRENCLSLISNYLKQEADKNVCSKDYNILVLYDDTTIVKSDADKIYDAVTKFTEKKPLILILFSKGGSAASAYLIGKLCREYSNGKLIVSVPRYAKSAATLIACAANEIHMGSLSELGPIDPQINKLPALGLKNSIEHIAELVKSYPEASEMFAKYLNSSLELINLGYYERVAESAKQYAEKLLETHPDNLTRTANTIADELVYKYKDHGFVIDKSEAEKIFGDDIIKKNTPEYDLGNTLYKALDLISHFANYVDHIFYFIGSLESEGNFKKKN